MKNILHTVDTEIRDLHIENLFLIQKNKLISMDNELLKNLTYFQF